MKKLLACFFLCLSCMFCMGGNIKEEGSLEEPENLYAKSAVLLDADSGRILFEKNGKESMPMASTTKIMTCILALENGNPEEKVCISKYAQKMPKVRLNIREGETYLLKDLLYSLMLESHNDSAVAIAEHIGGSVEGFAVMMNKKARDIGCFDTYFITPNGLDATTTITKTSGATEVKTHSTTAGDLAKIMAYCITVSPKKDAFLEITRTPAYHFSDLEGKRSFSCNNHNAFLSMMEGALSGKTGFTGKAGYCYVGALEREGKKLVVALLACGWPNNKSYKWSDTKKIMNYGLNSYEFHTFDEVPMDKEKMNPITVQNGQTEKINETARVSIGIAKKVNGETGETEEGLLMRKDEEITVKYEMKKVLQAPVERGETVGSIQYIVNGEIWKVENIVTQGKIDKIDRKWCFEKIITKLLL